MITSKTVKTVTFSKEEVIEALKDYAEKHGEILDGDVTIDPTYKTEANPGYDPHDCDYYVNVFDGITLKAYYK